MISKTGIQQIAILLLTGMLAVWVCYETKAYLRPDFLPYTIALIGLCVMFCGAIWVIDRKYKVTSFHKEEMVKEK